MNESLKKEIYQMDEAIAQQVDLKRALIYKAQADCKHSMIFEYNSPDGIIRVPQTYYVCNNCGLTEILGHTNKFKSYVDYPIISETMFRELKLGDIIC